MLGNPTVILVGTDGAVWKEPYWEPIDGAVDVKFSSARLILTNTRAV